jgi:ElaB/YqjD/DUF883 family membrane-anchored ribosome-binding protein
MNDMSTPKIDLQAATEPLNAEIAALRADLADLGKMVGRIGKDRAQGIKSAATTAASEGYARGEAAYDVALSELRSLENEVADATRRRPFASLGLAVLGGFLIGVIFRR